MSLSNVSIQPATGHQVFSQDTLADHLNLLGLEGTDEESEDAYLAPMLSSSVLQYDGASTDHVQVGLLGGLKRGQQLQSSDLDRDPRLLFNVTSPSSTFICGSQGSGKSHTLSCLLEACLLPSNVGWLPHPLTGVVFHYDAFISNTIGSPCEAAFLSSNADVKVRVLCSPTNTHTIRVRI